jgi:hypothetical protein
VWSYLSYSGMKDRPPTRWNGYNTLSMLLTKLKAELSLLNVPSADAIRTFVERCYRDTAYKYKGKSLRRVVFASQIDAKLTVYRQRFVEFGMYSQCIVHSMHHYD